MIIENDIISVRSVIDLIDFISLKGNAFNNNHHHRHYHHLSTCKYFLH